MTEETNFSIDNTSNDNNDYEEVDYQSLWLNFDAMSEIKSAILNFEKAESGSSVSMWHPTQTVQLLNNRPKTSASTHQYLSHYVTGIDRPEILNIKHSQLRMKVAEIKDFIETFIVDLIKYVEIKTEDSKCDKFENLIERYNFVKDYFQRIKCAAAILCFDLQSASDVTVNTDYARKTIGDINELMTEIGVLFEKFEYVVVLLKSGKEILYDILQVSSNLDSLEFELLQVEGWCNQDNEFDELKSKTDEYES